MIWDKIANIELHWFWDTIIIFIIGKFVLRLGGRKSISQMTITQTIVMVGIGSLLIQPLSGNNLVITLIISLLFTFLMIGTEYLEVKIDLWETFFTGKSVMVIENGEPKINNLKKLRMSIDRLETRLRQSGISSIKDVKYGTIEVSGQLGYELMENKKPMTKEDYNNIINEINQIKLFVGINDNKRPLSLNNNNDIFEEINSKKYEGNKKEP
ncbi:uncharacterized membrane protein YcaP (DUF421 family) [Sedimentibacter acidaminivorans]|uniref:Uncharacterized membrane protein YcaP (DUF421 family) n=1 Tax=Sedimentibacter acidaminivorans TaxID=913099 RepID=A0ABS4GBV6_9FIRM|nr:YetF domain-containing protein [Sedimentibacter acidaminivorans]MBP1925181.1 uncharacterized membrane protein YcaP (DUF421 family) [Sedimentibacter acidaminivorans]